jgi:hypothetical protein
MTHTLGTASPDMTPLISRKWELWHDSSRYLELWHSSYLGTASPDMTHISVPRALTWLIGTANPHMTHIVTASPESYIGAASSDITDLRTSSSDMNHISVLRALIWRIFQYCKSCMSSLSVLLAPTCLASVLESVNCFPGKRVIVLKHPNRTIYEITVYLWLVIGTIPASCRMGPEVTYSNSRIMCSFVLPERSHIRPQIRSWPLPDHMTHCHQAPHNLFNEHPEEQTKTHLPCSADRNVHPSDFSCRGLCWTV